MDIRVLFPERLRRPGQQPHDVGLAGTDVHIARHHLIGKSNLIFRHVNQLKNLLRPLAKQHSFLGQKHLAGAFGAADQQLFAKLLFKMFQLCGESGLREVQRLCRAGDALFSGHSQKIL